LSTTSAARDIRPDDDLAPTSPEPAPEPPFHLTEPNAPPPFRREAAERVAAHRARRGFTPASDLAIPIPTEPTRSRPSRVRSANIAAAVAERYAHSQTYRAFLATEAERAVHQAEAAAEVATINAQAIAIAQQQLLADLDTWSPAQQPSAPVAIPTIPLSPLDYAALFDRDFSASPATPVREPSLAHAAASTPVTLPSFTVQPFGNEQHPAPSLSRTPPPNPRAPGRELDLDEHDDECLALEEEIEFRHHPVFHEHTEQTPIAANLIEFPRQLIAARKVRPRLAEGPLRDEPSPTHSGSQLRIFEVEPEHLFSTPAADTSGPEWSSILLSALPTAEFTGSADYLTANVPQAAPISRRLKAAAIDGAILLVAQAAFLALFRLALTHLSGASALLEIPRPVAAAGVLATLAVFALLYQLLFFTLSDATPGMRLARIALCTFSDENPTRSAMRRRIVATLLAAFPLGIGLLWAFLDEDTLGWHDRISRMYQRSY